MRPPEFTGGNDAQPKRPDHGRRRASMRPPEFTGGNVWLAARDAAGAMLGFNEAAGIHRRKPAQEQDWRDRLTALQ